MTLSSTQRRNTFIIFYLFILVVTIFMLRSYLSALFVGSLIAYFLYPLYTKILHKVKSQRVTRVVLSLSVLAVLILVVGSLIIPLANQTQDLYSKSDEYVQLYVEQTNCKSGFVCDAVKSFRQYANQNEFTFTSQDLIQKVSGFLFQSLSGALTSILNLVVFMVVLLFSVYYFLDHGAGVKSTVLELIPLDNKYKQKIYTRLRETIDAVVGGNITTALMQGIAGGFIFWILGLPLPLFWGLVMMILAFIPAIGPALVWLPAVVIFFLEGSVAKGIILIVYGIVVLGFIENILKPKLIGKKINLPAFAVFLGVIGGLKMFGILGLFIGPIILALLVTFSDIYREMG